MAALTSARVTDGIMTLSVSPPWLKEESSIYERESYKDLYKIIFEGGTAQKNLDVIILGNPGIGKSYFALYALCNVLRAGKNVIFQCVPHNVVYWFKPGSSVLHANCLPLLGEKSDSMLFVDAGTRVTGTFPPYFSRTIVFSSPARQNYVGLYKLNTSVLMYMPVWSAEEVEHAASLLKFDVKSVMKNFDIYGGIPRFIFPSPDDLRRGNLLEDLNRAITKCDLDVVYALGATDPEEQSYRVLHRMLKCKDDGSPDYSNYCLDFASLYVSEKVFARIYEKEQQRLMSFLRASDGDSNLAALRGKLFEQKAHELLSNGGVFRIRELDSTGHQTKVVTQLRLPLKTVFRFNELTDAPTESSYYLKPQSKRYAAVDSISPPDMAFQMTVSLEHTIHIDIQKIVNYYSPAEFKLYIVVPDSIFDSIRKVQPYVEKYGRVVKCPPRVIERIKQYVLSIPLNT